MMNKQLTKKIKNKKGFTLVELIVVIAVLGIIAAIAVPNYLGIQKEARIKSDSSTAASIVKAARLQHSVDEKVVTGLKDATTPGTNPLKVEYFDGTKTPQSGGTFELSYNSDGKYEVKWTSDATKGDGKTYTYIEGADKATTPPPSNG
ncbi:N-terminal methylation site-containing protein [Desulfonispora thiosulfatigenes DSM 11270]|uniref:N-terminal methylation site-containing protein n=1 Tax=Desulfonispora thiosulfatigenes DSM 11270 TaxID=656914 RepID=A0A1W1VPG7_DESTI|nr:type II secretion system protein [Desulfonispora thiosulfatigenes]SMB94961.1 N-terminal methylation site-containing protein [Desulfonispora thiosulfatigenes DSM 11270]